jgi:hypothetical protein
MHNEPRDGQDEKTDHLSSKKKSQAGHKKRKKMGVIFPENDEKKKRP